MEAFWNRLRACERRLERYRRIIANLVRSNRALQQQLRDQRSTP